MRVKTSPDLPHIPVQHSAWVERGKAAAVRRLLRRVQFERLWRTACTRGWGGIQRFRGDLDYFRFCSFKSQRHPSNRTTSDFVEIKKKKKKVSPNKVLLLSLSNAPSIWQMGKKKKTLRRNESQRIHIRACRHVWKHLKKWSHRFSLIWYHQYNYREPSSLHMAPWDPNQALSCASVFPPSAASSTHPPFPTLAVVNPSLPKSTIYA